MNSFPRVRTFSLTWCLNWKQHSFPCQIRTPVFYIVYLSRTYLPKCLTSLAICAALSVLILMFPRLTHLIELLSHYKTLYSVSFNWVLASHYLHGSYPNIFLKLKFISDLAPYLTVILPQWKYMWLPIIFQLLPIRNKLTLTHKLSVTLFVPPALWSFLPHVLK